MAKDDKKTIAKPVERREFSWKEANKVERICYIASLGFMIAALVFVILEFTYPWAKPWFELFFGTGIIVEAGCYFRIQRKLSIALGCIGLIMVILGILGFCGVL